MKVAYLHPYGVQACMKDGRFSMLGWGSSSGKEGLGVQCLKHLVKLRCERLIDAG